MQKDLTDRDLVIAASKGDRPAFDQLVKRFQAPLCRSVEARLGAALRGRMEVNDVVQEAFTRAYQSLRSFEWQGDNSFLGWLRKISEHVILNAADREKSERSFRLSGRAVQSGSEVTASRTLRRRERFERLEKALASLSPDHRKVIVLARMEGLQMKEIASRMDRSVTAVQKLLLRALKELKEVFGETESFHLPDRRFDEGGSDEG